MANGKSRFPFPFGWYSWELGGYRPAPSMYWIFEYDLLPPLPPPDPTFRFLAPDADTLAPDPAFDASRDWLHQHLLTLTESAARHGIALPKDFTRFIRSLELQARIRADCWGFMLSNQLVPCPCFDGGYLVAFLREQQDCAIWCLCLAEDGESCVVEFPSEALDALPEAQSDALLGYLEPDEIADIEDLVMDSDERAALLVAAADIHIGAISFPEFIYRFWIEDEIGLKLIGLDKTPLTDAERRYVEHYARQRPADG
ncbi:MAG: hypothetical protein KGO05_01450 [Chloroflexota bacterium]|nr:hypothetical protein [Chloroflexota bacterium]